MRAHTYSKFSPELADAVDLQSLLDKLADFLLQSGFAGGRDPSHFGFDFGDENDRSMDALRQAILDALMQRLVNEGYLNTSQPPQMPAGHEQMQGPGSVERAAARDVQFSLSEK